MLKPIDTLTKRACYVNMGSRAALVIAHKLVERDKNKNSHPSELSREDREHEGLGEIVQTHAPKIPPTTRWAEHHRSDGTQTAGEALVELHEVYLR